MAGDGSRTSEDLAQEAARVTRPGGGLFVFDYERLSGDNECMQEFLYARAIPFTEMREAAVSCGWSVISHDNPVGNDAVFRSVYDEYPNAYDEIFSHLRPVLWKAVRV